jgi:hypothetical protein
MLECVICNGRKWKSLEAAHEEDLRLSGAARLFCDGCTRETYWLYSRNDAGAAPVRRTAEPPMRAESQAPSPAPPAAEPAPRSVQTERRVGSDRRGRSRRANRRVALQVPVRVRVMSAGSQFEEVTRTVNVCRNGLYIQSERQYAKGLPIYVAMNYSAKEPSMAAEQKATVVRVDSVPGVRSHGIAIQMQ